MSSSEVVVDVRGVGKRYDIYAAPRDRLKQMVVPRLVGALSKMHLAPAPGAQAHELRYFREFWALRDISFEVRRGESLAIIGRNGSGKSTLLQIIAGTLAPTLGQAQARGRIAALLELGSGFNPEFSGRDNVYLNCAILGMSRREVDERMDGILAFADIGDFIDEPVKTYSSGMMVRLAFAVQANIDADIVIIDEALAVGDVFFAQKCFARLRALVDGGAAVIFVTHDMSTVTQFCRSALVLHHGREFFRGDPVTAIRRYMSVERGGEAAPQVRDKGPVAPVTESGGSADRPEHGRWLSREALVRRSDADVVGSEKAEFLGATICDSQGEQSEFFEMGDTAEFHYDFLLNDDIGVPVGGLSIVNDKNIIVHGKNSMQTNLEAPAGVCKGSVLRFRQRVALDLAPGEYSVVIGLSTLDEESYRHHEFMRHDDLSSKTQRVSSVGRACSFRVVLRREGLALTHHGLCNLPGEVSLAVERAGGDEGDRHA